MAEREELDGFLSSIDDIHRIVQTLSSGDENEVSRAMQESDVLLKQTSKIGVNRTVINKTETSQEQMSSDAFMSALEKDAKERTENRRQNKILADELKTKGNDAFHQQFYDQAIEYYTQGLQLKKDYDLLYTNRAQVYVKQNRYQQAIEDCNWALKVTPTLIKAYIIKGKCWINLQEFDRAEEEFKQAEQIAINQFEPSTTRRMIQECLIEVKRQRDRYEREESARMFLVNDDPSVPMTLSHTLNKLQIDKQPVIYYVGGIDLLCQLIHDEMTRTAFRVHHGFQLFNSHSIIITSENSNLLESILNLMIILSREDEENAKQCLESILAKTIIDRPLTTTIGIQLWLQFLVDISLKTSIRSILLQKMPPNKFIPRLSGLIDDSQLPSIIHQHAARLLSNLAVEPRVKQFFASKEDLTKFTGLLKSFSIDEQTRTILLSMLTNLCSEKHLRLIVLNHSNVLSDLIHMLNDEQGTDERQSNVLGLLINLTNETSDALSVSYRELCNAVIKKLKNHSQRVLTLLGNITMHCEQSVFVLVEHRIISQISQSLQQNSIEDNIRAGIRLLALCTQSNEQARQTVIDDNKLLSLVYDQLVTSQHPLLVGNAALVLGHVVVHPSTCKFFRRSQNVIGQLLKLVEETWLSKAAKKNVAILITKLVKTDESFLNEFREQHGTEILHSVLKNVVL